MKARKIKMYSVFYKAPYAVETTTHTTKAEAEAKLKAVAGELSLTRDVAWQKDGGAEIDSVPCFFCSNGDRMTVWYVAQTN
jgi:hypothetical protein